MKSTKKEREQALADFLGCDADEVKEADYGNNYFEAEGCEYLVLTDEEADEACIDYIKDSVWAFNSSFLSYFCDLPEEVFTALQPQCESSNEAILKLIERSEGGFEGFVEEAISADGRGHFISSYDGEEIEEGDYFIYRTN